IRRAGLYTEEDPDKLGRLLRWSGPYPYGPGLVIPFRAPDGYARVKPARPRPKGGKYESPRGLTNRPYVPPGGGTAAALADPAQPLILTEGEKKAVAADQAGYPCMGLVGVWGWQQPRPRDARGRGYGPRKLLPELRTVPWKGRKVFVVFDSDAATKPDVRRAT